MTTQPNLIFVFADQLRLQSCGYSPGYADNTAPYTPNIDSLASESANFTNAVSGSPLCASYRSSLFTGKFVSSTGMVINEIRTMPDPDAIAHVLGEQGYDTGYLGKWHLYGRDHTENEQRVPPGPDRLGFDGVWKAYNFNHRYYDGFYFDSDGEKTEVDGYFPHTMTDTAVDFIDDHQNSDNPFALFISYGPPHDPWTDDNCPEPFTHLFRGEPFPDPPNYADGHARYWNRNRDEKWWNDEWKPDRFQKRRGYAAQTASLDWEVGRLLHAIDRQNLRDDTIVVFTSDHGEMFGSHGRIAKNIFYEEAVRVPFLLRYPAEIDPHEYDTCLNTPDIAPTLLGLLDLPIPDSMEGMDLSGIARGQGGSEPEAAFLQGMGHTYQWEDGNEWRAVRDGRFTYARWLNGEELLFDNVNDRYQLENLVGNDEFADDHERLRTIMERKLDELDDPFKPTTWYNGRWVKDRVIVKSATRELSQPE